MKKNEVKLDEKYLLDGIKQLSGKYDTHKVFGDFVTISAHSINNRFNYSEDKEQEYLRIINSYTKEEQEILLNMFAALVNGLNADEFNDVLGKLFEELNMQNKAKGQYFIPAPVCDFMAKVAVDDNVEEIIKTKGYYSMQEPACGSGRMIYSFLKEMRVQNINYHKEVYIEATDISQLLAYITFIQLSLYGANAKVFVGNALSQEFSEVLCTPMYYLFPINIKELQE
ncbi:MAG: N-6 DNA methylase [Bacilli bacterium]|nr:N-6 DNA methylase [Bacilli bacterium]